MIHADNTTRQRKGPETESHPAMSIFLWGESKTGFSAFSEIG
jgi:hypothetical protein